MSLGNDIAAYLQTSKIGTVGTTIFSGPVPHTDVPALGVNPTPGNAPPVDWSGEFPAFIVVARGSDYDDAETLITAAYVILHKAHGITINTHYYHWIAANGSPSYIGKADDGFHEFVCNFSVVKNL